jgi:hypothetical protein
MLLQGGGVQRGGTLGHNQPPAQHSMPQHGWRWGIAASISDTQLLSAVAAFYPAAAPSG